MPRPPSPREKAASQILTVRRRGTEPDLDTQHWLDNPAKFVDYELPGLDLTFYQYEILEATGTYLRWAIKGPRGLGKTAIGALKVLHFVKSREAMGIDWKLATTSGRFAQLKYYLWPEIHKWNMRLRHPLSDKQLLTMEIGGKYGRAFAASPARPELIEGIHADSVFVLFDEAKMIQPGLFDSIEGAALNAESQETHIGALSTPGAPIGRFYDIHARRPGFEDWYVRSVTLDEAIEAGRVTESEVDRMAALWGRTSALFRQHVLGEFAADDDEALIPLAWVEAANARWRDWDDDERPGLDDEDARFRWGVDVARHGKDQTVLAKFLSDRILVEINRERFTDNVSDLGDRVAAMMTEADEVTVDADGMGAGTADRLRTLIGDDRVTVFHGAPRPEGWVDATGEKEAHNTRAAAWWSLRERLNPAADPVLALPPDDGLIGDLTGPRAVYDTGGRIKIEKKEDTKKRLGRSPDAGDAVVMGLWVPPRVLGDEYAGLAPSASTGGKHKPDLSMLPASARKSMGYS